MNLEAETNAFPIINNYQKYVFPFDFCTTLYYHVRMTQIMKASEARQQWSQILNKVFRNQTRVLVEKSGIPVAAVISIEDLERFTQLEEQRKDRFKALDTMREAFKDVDPSEAEKEIAKAITEVRAERRSPKNSS